MAPLAGRPPFATDEPESFYESAPQPRLRQPSPSVPNQRTSAYNVYDSYLGDDKNRPQPPLASSNRNSGVGALGLGLLNMDDSDSEDDDDDTHRRDTQRMPIKPPGIGGSPLQPQQIRGPTLPGFNSGLHMPQPIPASPAPSMPHPLYPSVTPITPAFIRPSKSPVRRNGNTVNVKFSEGVAVPRKPIIRGNSEETLLPGRGEKGDDFWRRFSMVAKEGNERSQKESSWLHQTRNGSARFSRGIWVTAVLIILLIAGGVALGVFMRRNAPSHQQPKVFGGSADSLATSTSVSSLAPSGLSSPTASSSLHVSPTLTLKNREEPESTPPAVPSKHRRMYVQQVNIF